MSTLLQFALPVIAIALCIVILSQSKGAGLGAAFGGGGEFYATKRGAEKVLFKATVYLAGAFLILSFLAVTVFNDAPAVVAPSVEFSSETGVLDVDVNVAPTGTEATE